MSVTAKNNVFVIETQNTNYAIGITHQGVMHLHWGRKCPDADFEAFEYYEQNSNHSALDFAKTEYAPFGGTMYRECALKCTFADGCRDTALEYKGSEVNENELSIILRDKHYPLEVRLVYKAFEETDIIERYTEIKNTGKDKIFLEKAASAELNFPSGRAYTFTNTNGSWGGEFRRTDQKLESGALTFESRKGITGHHHLPAIIASENASEEYGAVYFAVLACGGNFKASAARDFTGTTRAVIGLNDFDFSQSLNENETFRTPSVYCGYADGFCNMSNMLSKFAVLNVLPENFAEKELPVLYNSWEATGFDVSAESQLRIASIAAEIGCELFVMDDGWFGERKNDWAGLGDWNVNSEKFPQGLAPLIEGVNKLGMDFGIWFEPEMVNPDSELYRNHPEWTYNYSTRKPSELRHQLVLNMTKPEVQEYIFGCIDHILSNNNIKYIKWDMNRPFSEIGAENLENPKELWQKHTQATFNVVDRLRKKHPEVQFEACASGGGRADLGALSHYDMAWTSDNTDPVDRLDIQHGFSLLYPIKCMRAWVTDANRQTRPVSLDYRFNVSMQGSLSIGANLLEYSEEELEKCKKYIGLYKKIRKTVQFGNLYRIMTYEKDGIYLNGYVSKDKAQAVYFACTGANTFFGGKYKTLIFRGLDENAFYKVESEWRNVTKSGAYLMNRGIDIRYDKPLESEIFICERQ